jgi:preprotein translocase subunit SecG
MVGFLTSLLWGIYLLDCILLIGIILLQPGEGGDISAAFGGSSSQTAFGARGSATFMQKVTTSLAVGFMLMSVALVLITNMRQRNLMEKYTPPAKKSAPAKPGPAVPPAQGQPAPAPAPAPAK